MYTEVWNYSQKIISQSWIFTSVLHINIIIFCRFHVIIYLLVLSIDRFYYVVASVLITMFYSKIYFIMLHRTSRSSRIDPVTRKKNQKD